MSSFGKIENFRIGVCWGCRSLEAINRHQELVNEPQALYKITSPTLQGAKSFEESFL
jgi:hypothetical protein